MSHTLVGHRRKQRVDERLQESQKLARGCHGKIRQPSKKLAKAQAERLWRHEADIVSVYKCHLCQGWHVGHDRRTQQELKR